MGSTTPVFAFPYPVGTDRVMDGDNAIQALAEKIENVKATKTVLAASGGASVQDADGCNLYRLPGEGILRLFMFNSGALAANTILTTISPAALRPVIRLFGLGIVITPTPAAFGLDIDVTGTVKNTNAIAAGSIWGATIAYPIA